jgi:hypothetical protein
MSPLLLLLACTSVAPPPGASGARLSLDDRVELPPADPPAEPRDWGVADLTGDGSPELVQLLRQRGVGATLRVLSTAGDALGPDHAVPELDGAVRLLMADLDGDLWPDAVIAETTTVHKLPGQPDATFGAPEPYALGPLVSRGPESCLAAGDLDGDGVEDLVAGTQTAAEDMILAWLSTSGSPEPDHRVVLGPTGFGMACAVADLDGDGDDDVVTWHSDTLQFIPNLQGQLGLPQPLWTAPSPFRVSMEQVPDVEGDGDDEVAVRLQSSVAPVTLTPAGSLLVWEGAPDPTRSTLTVLPDSGSGDGLAVGDLDDDGHADLAVGFSDPGRAGLRLIFGSLAGFEPSRARYAPLPAAGVIGAEAWLVLDGQVLASWSTALGTEHALLPLSPDGVDGDGDGTPVELDPDDTRPEAFPGALESPSNGLDEDGDGWDLCPIDLDDDGWTAPELLPTIGGCFVHRMTEPDCDDLDPAVHPEALEPAGVAVDLDCDGAVRCYQDLDGDGFGAPDQLTLPGDADCDDPGEAPPDRLGDCDDTNAAANPDAIEQPNDGVDADCDGTEPCYVDADGDGARVLATVLSTDTTCGGAAGQELPFDCDDDDALVRPGQTEIVGDGLDQDCVAGDLCAADGDADGLGSLTETILSDDLDCDDPGEGLPLDCDDRRKRVGQAEGGVCPEGGCSTAPGDPRLAAALLVLLLGRRGAIRSRVSANWTAR